MGTVVKSEPRQDDREINEMAKRIIEQNKQKAAQQPGVHPGFAGQGIHMGRPGQPGVPPYYQNRAGQNIAASTSTASVPEVEKKIDEESRRGRFGWCEFEKNFIPYIFRTGKQEKYTSVRMVERKLLNKFLSVLPAEVNSCHCIRSYYITEHESKLLNEINLKHADCHFGKEAFTSKDLVVRLADAKEFYRFLDLCYKKLVLKRSNASDRCGFFRINGESVVPYTMRANTKYVPLFYFEGETDHLKLTSDQVDGWDLAYLKFCCKVQGIRNELFAADVCRVVALDEIRGHFPQGTTFEDYWPAKGSIEPVNHAQRVSAGNWTQKPATAAPNTSQSAQSSTPARQSSTQSQAAVHAAAAAAAQQQAVQQAAVNAAATQASAVAALNSSLTYASNATRVQQAAQAAVAAYDAAALNQLQQQFLRNNVAAAAQVAAAQQQQQQRAALQQQQQILRAAGYDTTAMANAQQAAAAAARLATQAAAAQVLQQTAAHQQRQSHSQPSQDRSFPGKLTQIKEFPIERSQQPPYKLQKALIDQKIVPCINVRPYVFHDLMMTLPDFVRHFYPELSIEKARHMLQDILKVVLYKGNTGHQEILRGEGKCNQFDPVPLVLVKDIMNYMPQMKYMFNNIAATASTDPPSSKRTRVS